MSPISHILTRLAVVDNWQESSVDGIIYSFSKYYSGQTDSHYIKIKINVDGKEFIDDIELPFMLDIRKVMEKIANSFYNLMDRMNSGVSL